MMPDADGSISRTLLELIAGDVDDSLRAAYAELTDFYKRTGFYVTHLHNVLVVRDADGGQRLVLAEIKSRYPMVIVMPSVQHRRMRRKIAHLQAQFDKHASSPKMTVSSPLNGTASGSPSGLGSCVHWGMLND